MKDYSMIVGLDVGDKYSCFHVIDVEGRFIEEGRIRTLPEAVEKKFRGLSRSLVALEVGMHSPWISRLIEGCSHRVLVANACRIRMIYDSRNKQDKVDAETLARLGRLDAKLLSPITHRNEQAQLDLAMLRSRDALVRARTKLINHVRGMVKVFGYRIPSCSSACFGKRAREAMPECLKENLGGLVGQIELLTNQIAGYDRAIEKIGQKYPEIERLKGVSGVGTLTALAFVLTLEDPRRFRKSRDVGAYLGLVARRDQSGESDRQLRITKTGNRFLRRLLVGSAHHILGPFGPDCALRRFGMEMAARGGKNAKKRATVAVARKLAVMLHHLWLNKEEYIPDFQIPAAKAESK